MKDSSSLRLSFDGFSQKTKIITAVTLGTLFVAAPVIYAVSTEPKIIEKKEEIGVEVIGDEDVDLSHNSENERQFAMQEDFFTSGRNKGQEANSAKIDSALESMPLEKLESSKGLRSQESFAPRNTYDSDSSFAQNAQNVPSPIAGTKSGSIFNEPKDLISHSQLAKSNEPSSPKKPASPKIDYFNHNEEEKSEEVLELLADKDFPSTVASKPYDLSRLLTTDSFIPAVMYTAINSEIPSKTVLAIVESDVVGFHGENILIPKGSKVEGVYEKLDNKHARRMQITWFKITRPDGVIIRLDAESADAQGAGGLGGYLDQRLKDRYGGAILLSSINALAQMSVKENDIRQLAAAESFGREFGTLTAQIIRENINAMPIIMIRQGMRFNIRPYSNIYFPKPKNKQVNALFINQN